LQYWQECIRKLLHQPHWLYHIKGEKDDEFNNNNNNKSLL
jgi:hypothetical protein